MGTGSAGERTPPFVARGSMTRKPAEVTETEFAILDVLWTKGVLTVREIVAELYGKHSPSLHATVKSLLDRLSEKGFISCDARQFAHKFLTLISRDEFVGGQLKELAASHFGGSLAPMMLALLDQTELSRKDYEAIRRIIQKID